MNNHQQFQCINNIKRFPRYVNSSQVKDLSPLEEIQINPLSEIEKYLTKGDRCVFNYLLLLSNTHPDIYPTHETIATTIGFSIKTVVRSVAKLKKLGLINYEFRRNHSSLYRVSSFFSLPWVRDKLKKILPALSCVATIFIYSQSPSQNSLQSEKYHDVTNSFSLSLLVVNKNILVNYDYNKGSRPAVKKTGVRVMNSRIEKLRELLHLEFYEAQGLEKYPDKILDKALKAIDRIKSSQRKSDYLFALCESELHPKPKIEAAYKHLSSKYIKDSDNSSGVKPPSHKEYKPIKREIDILTQQVFEEKVKKCHNESNNNPFYNFVIGVLTHRFNEQNDNF